MADEEKKDAEKKELAKVDESKSGGLTLDQVMAHPAVQQLSQRLEETKQLLQSLPEAIGRAVAEAQRAGRRPLVSGPAVELRPSGDGSSIEFHRKGKIVENGKVVAQEGPTQGDFDKDLEDIRRKAPPQEAQAAVMAIL